MGQASDEDIRRRAYDLWVAEGRPHGRDRDHWDQAARELDATPAAEPATGKAASRKPKAAIGTMRATAEPAAEAAMEEIASEAAKGTVEPDEPAAAAAPKSRKPRARKG
ncbi:Protein of unknown function [Devosia enhydra]|uniref:DUF2934 domain-containing protein n=1 Tax=Devosia enhydra TaxID=665118 RepID=A0A1K2I094_9HYPH|nr:DUF2934 domain-containing protein [Devosia enhydra]SFZ85813.1 Protein of unknown function [Devosia enhydra]